MSDLKSFLWNKRTPTSERNKYFHQILKLTEWPDFGIVDHPRDYIVMSAYLVKQAMSFEALEDLTGVETKTINHFVYVCQMLGIIKITEPEKSNSKLNMKRLLKTDLSVKLRAMFF